MTKDIVREQEYWINSTAFDLWKSGMMHEGSLLREKSFREFFDLPEDSILLQRNEAYHYAMFDMREKMWVETITKYLNTRWARQVFVAVGLAHLHPKHASFVQRLLDEGWELVGARPEIVDISEYYR